MLNLKNKNLLKCSSYINGFWLAKSESNFNVHNPANLDIIASVSSANSNDVLNAVDAAEKALPLWRKLPAKTRSNILKKWFDLIIKNKEDLALILSVEQGKPLAESLGEILYGANYIEWFAEEAKRVYGDVIPAPSDDKKIIVIKQPIGIVSSITPWNFPNAMITRKAAPALAVGCTFIVKPAQETPLSALALAVLAQEAGIPPGVFNVVISNKSKEIGRILTGDPRIKKFSFTGSTAVGKILLKQCADTVKKTSMELGGNAPFIVFDDADIKEAVKGAIISKFRNAGQTCVCTNRIMVQENVYDEFIEQFTVAVKSLKLGSYQETDTILGPLVSEKAANDVHTLVEDAITSGAKLITGGTISSQGKCFYEPTILVDVTPSMSIVKGEIFGPVATIMKFDNETQAIQIANNTEVGLACYIYTRDIGRIWRVSEALEYGMVGINEGIISNEMAPFGGIKESGNGREGSKYGLDDYLEIKYLCMGGLQS